MPQNSDDPQSGQKAQSQPPQRKAATGEIRQTQATIEQSFFAGPLPHPDILGKYDSILPGAADRIIGMAEKQAQHRQAMERWRERSETILTFAGQICALVFVLVMIVAAAYCIVKGRTWGGVGLGATGIISIVYAFIQGHKHRQQSAPDDSS